jgi:peptide/nickel transport system permease protein
MKQRSNSGRVLMAALRTRRGQVGALLAIIVLFIAFAGPFLPHPSPTAFVSAPFTRPGGQAGWLGTDELGRSVVGRIMDGGWRLMLSALIATVLAVAAGSGIGVTAAYRRGVLDSLLMRSVDVSLAMPQLVFVLLMLSIISPSAWLLVLCVGIAQAPMTARVIHAAAQEVCERDFVKAVAVWGVPSRAVIRRHVLPSLLTPLMVEVGIRLSASIILISGLSFLGFGTPPPNPDWAVMVNENRLGLWSNYWSVIAPALLLALLAVGVNMFTDAIARSSLGETRGERAIMASLTAEGDA